MGMIWPDSTLPLLGEPFGVTQKFSAMLAADASPEPVTSTAPVTIQGDEGASPVIFVLAFVAPLLIVALALGAVYQLFRWIERRRG